MGVNGKMEISRERYNELLLCESQNEQIKNHINACLAMNPENDRYYGTLLLILGGEDPYYERIMGCIR